MKIANKKFNIQNNHFSYYFLQFYISFRIVTEAMDNPLSNTFPFYATPKVLLVTLQQIKDPLITTKIKKTHGQYVHIFNVTKYKLDKQDLFVKSLSYSNFKWRGVPFSLSEVIKIQSKIDSFLRSNMANTAIILVNEHNQIQFGFFLIRMLFRVLQISSKSVLSLSKELPQRQFYLQNQYQRIFEEGTFDCPPIKLIEAIYIKSRAPAQPYLPIFRIFTQTRYNDFQHIYTHDVTSELTQYYLNLNRNLQTSHGDRYDPLIPETQYLQKPVLVAGDFKIQFFSFRTLKLVQQCVVGLNTMNIKDNLIILKEIDMYNRRVETAEYQIHIKLANYCENDNQMCCFSAICSSCLDLTKKIQSKYKQCQVDLEKIRRNREKSQVSKLLGIF